MKRDKKRGYKHIKMVGAIVTVALNTFILGNLKNLDFNSYTKSKSSGVNLVLAASNTKDIDKHKRLESQIDELERIAQKELYVKAKVLTYDNVIQTIDDLNQFRNNVKFTSTCKDNLKSQKKEMVLIDKNVLNDLILEKKTSERRSENLSLSLNSALLKSQEVNLSSQIVNLKKKLENEQRKVKELLVQNRKLSQKAADTCKYANKVLKEKEELYTEKEILKKRLSEIDNNSKDLDKRIEIKPAKKKEGTSESDYCDLATVTSNKKNDDDFYEIKNVQLVNKNGELILVAPPKELKETNINKDLNTINNKSEIKKEEENETLGIFPKESVNQNENVNKNSDDGKKNNEDMRKRIQNIRKILNGCTYKILYTNDKNDIGRQIFDSIYYGIKDQHKNPAEIKNKKFVFAEDQVDIFTQVINDLCQYILILEDENKSYKDIQEEYEIKNLELFQENQELKNQLINNESENEKISTEKSDSNNGDYISLETAIERIMEKEKENIELQQEIRELNKNMKSLQNVIKEQTQIIIKLRKDLKTSQSLSINDNNKTIWTRKVAGDLRPGYKNKNRVTPKDSNKKNKIMEKIISINKYKSDNKNINIPNKNINTNRNINIPKNSEQKTDETTNFLAFRQNKFNLSPLKKTDAKYKINSISKNEGSSNKYYKDMKINTDIIKNKPDRKSHSLDSGKNNNNKMKENKSIIKNKQKK